MKVLIVDDESDITEMMEFLIQDKFPDGTETICTSSGNKAIQILREHNDIDLCICDHSMTDGMGTHVLKYLMEVQSKTKFVLCSTLIMSDKPVDYPVASVFFNIQKPHIVQGVEEILRLLENEIAKRRENITNEYIPIALRMLLLLGKTPADVYLRMSDNKFIKCMNHSENFIESDYEKFAQKGNDKFYIKKGEQKYSLDEVVSVAVQEIMIQRNLSLSQKMSKTHAHLAEMIKFTGLTPVAEEALKNTIQQSVDLVSKLPLVSNFWTELNLLGPYPSMLYTLHSMLGAMIAKKLSWNTKTTIYKLTLAAFLQDISLDSITLMELIDYQEFLQWEAKFTADEVKKYREHPMKTSQMILSLKDIPSGIDHILLEQHEMPEGNGFPRQLNANQLGPLSCVFILSGIFARCVLKEGSAFDLNKFILFVEKRGYSRGNFREVFEAIKGMTKV